MATARVRRLDANWDITFGHGGRDYATMAEATAQRLIARLRTILGEWFLDTSKGVPWVQDDNGDVQPIMGGHATPAYAEATIKATILGTDGVASIANFAMSLDHQTRKLTVTTSGVTVDGDVWNIRVASP